MTKTIWKYELKINDELTIEMPVDSKILSLQNQNDKPMLWVLVDPEEKMEKRKFVVVGTGYYISDIESKKYIGTVQVQKGRLVFHVFEQY